MKRSFITITTLLTFTIGAAIPAISARPCLAQENNSRPELKDMLFAGAIYYNVDGKQNEIKLPKYCETVVTSRIAQEFVTSEDGATIKYNGPLTFVYKNENQEQSVKADSAIFLISSRQLEAEWKKTKEEKKKAEQGDKPEPK